MGRRCPPINVDLPKSITFKTQPFVQTALFLPTARFLFIHISYGKEILAKPALPASLQISTHFMADASTGPSIFLLIAFNHFFC